MGRPKGGKNRRYSIEEKLRVVKLYLEEHVGLKEIKQNENIVHSVILSWVNNYLENGEKGLVNKKKTGNQFAALHTSKSLSVEERLRLENMKLRIENERLKKGYQVKGVGANKEFVITKD